MIGLKCNIIFSGMSEDIQEKISRRQFLAQSGKLFAALGFTALGSSCARFIEKTEEKPEYLEIEENTPITLLKGNSADSINLKIIYTNSNPFNKDNFENIQKISLRKETGKITFLPFQPGNKNYRLLGEVIEPKIFKVVIKGNEEVGRYSIPAGYRDSNSRRMTIPEDKEIYGIPVIVGPCNYFPGNESPKEINANTNKREMEMLPSFGIGFFIGTLSKIPDDNDQFFSLGYVCDARALEVSNP